MSKLRELLKNVDPNICGLGTYFLSGRPNCPLGHALNLVDKAQRKESNYSPFNARKKLRELGISESMESRFYRTWSYDYQKTGNPTEAMEAAIKAAEEVEAQCVLENS